MKINKYKEKYLIVGPWPNNKKKVYDLLKENTDFNMAVRKLRPIQLATSTADVAIGHQRTTFNNPNVTENIAFKDLADIEKYNIKLIYVNSSKNRESHMILESQIKLYKKHVTLMIPEPFFEHNTVEDRLRTHFKDRWKK